MLLRVSACADDGRLMLLLRILLVVGCRFVSWVSWDRLGMTVVAQKSQYVNDFKREQE